MIKIFNYNELGQELLEELTNSINDQFGSVPIVKETEWSTPDWSIIYFDEGNIAAFLNIVMRQVKFDDAHHAVGGLNNLITKKEYRKKGLGSQLVRRANTFILDEMNCDFGLLLCADELVRYYTHLDWVKVDCPVYFQQPGGKKLWQANTMLISKNRNDQIEQFNTIDLNGLPW